MRSPISVGLCISQRLWIVKLSRDTGCDIVTMGQYLQPTPMHLPVDRWVTPEEFDRHRTEGEAAGLPHIEAGPLVRSSYHAGAQYRRALEVAAIA